MRLLNHIGNFQSINVYCKNHIVLLYFIWQPWPQYAVNLWYQKQLEGKQVILNDWKASWLILFEFKRITYFSVKYFYERCLILPFYIWSNKSTRNMYIYEKMGMLIKAFKVILRNMNGFILALRSLQFVFMSLHMFSFAWSKKICNMIIIYYLDDIWSFLWVWISWKHLFDHQKLHIRLLYLIRG